MSLLDANADSLRLSAVNAAPLPAALMAPGVTQPEPGVFKGFASGAGSYFMRSMAETGRAASMAVGAVPALADKVLGTDGTEESLADRYFRFHDDTFGRAVDYWTPKPHEVGAAGQVVGSLAGGLVQFLANPALLVGTAQLSTSEDLVRQGVDPGAALVAGDVAGLATVAGIGIPIFGRKLGERVAAGIAGNLATSIPEAAIKRAVVDASGAHEAAQQFDPWDMRARVVDVLMGGAFGWKAHLDARASVREQAFLDGPIPSQRTAIADAAARTVDAGMSASQRDAIMVMNSSRHIEEAATPGRPAGDAELNAAVDDVHTAMEQMLRGEAVNLPSREPTAADPLAADQAVVRRTSTGSYEILDANGQTVGAIVTTERNTTHNDQPTPVTQIKNSGIDDASAQGQGLGTRAYMAVVDDALGRGRIVWSDTEVSADAIRVYEALQRRGYSVEQNEARPPVADETGKLSTSGSYVFRVTAAPERATARPTDDPAKTEFRDGMREVYDEHIGERPAEISTAEPEPRPAADRPADVGEPRDLQAETIAGRKQVSVLNKLLECLNG